LSSLADLFNCLIRPRELQIGEQLNDRPARISKNRVGEVGLGKVRPEQICVPKVRHEKPRIVEIRCCEVCVAEVDPLEVGPGKVGPGKVGSMKVRNDVTVLLSPRMRGRRT
jgi:hypothetical protein